MCAAAEALQAAAMTAHGTHAFGTRAAAAGDGAVARGASVGSGDGEARSLDDAMAALQAEVSRRQCLSDAAGAGHGECAVRSMSVLAARASAVSAALLRSGTTRRARALLLGQAVGGAEAPLMECVFALTSPCCAVRDGERLRRSVPQCVQAVGESLRPGQCERDERRALQPAAPEYQQSLSKCGERGRFGSRMENSASTRRTSSCTRSTRLTLIAVTRGDAWEKGPDESFGGPQRHSQ